MAAILYASEFLSFTVPGKNEAFSLHISLPETKSTYRNVNEKI